MSFILDFGSGNSCLNDEKIVQKMIDELAQVDPDRKCIIKWQLFKEAGNNIPLNKYLFALAHHWAGVLGFKTTASVFDLESLQWLLQFDIPFVKIANRPDLYWLIEKVPRGISIIQSIDKNNLEDFKYYKNKFLNLNYDGILCCISKYPATMLDYINNYYNSNMLSRGISDHTCDWKLYRKCRPDNYEVHFKLPDSTGLDAGEFARTPDMLKEIYNDIK
jgi:sialic acid synthase SpsE